MSIQIVEIAQPSVIDTVAVAQPSTVDVVEVRQGPAGAAGAAGPNSVTSATTTNLTGYIFGNGTTIAGATAATDAATANTLVLRDANGGADFSGTVSLNIAEVTDLRFEDYQAAVDATFLYNGTSASAHRIALGAGTTGATLFGAADAGAARTTLGLATADSPTFAGITASGTVIFGAGAAILNSPSAGIFTITNAAGTGFGRLCFGPATSSFAAFRSTGTTIDVVTGSESGFANMQMNNLTISGQLVVSNTPLASNTNVAGTTGAQNAFTLSTTTNGTAAATFGPRLRFQAESASGTTRDAAAIDAAWTDATDATRTADIVFNTVSSASALTERMRLSSQGNLTASGTVKTGGYTFATLPTPTTGMRAYITDGALAPIYMANAAGGSTVVTPVFYNGTNWINA